MLHESEESDMRTMTLKILIIFVLYCTAVSFLLLGVNLFYEEQAHKKILQKNISHAAAESTGAHSLLFFPEAQLLQKGIAKQVIRLHIKANSNSTEDQLLKLHVRDAVITDLQNSLKHATSQKSAESIITSKISDIQKTVKQKLAKEGSPYDAKVTLRNQLFPVKQYGDLTFPAGIYRSLCIDIGNAEGHNWWCVLFPSLCFVNETTAKVPAESKKKLKKSLTKKEYELLKEPPEAHSLFADWISSR